MSPLSSRLISCIAASLVVALFLLAVCDGLHVRQSHHRVVSDEKIPASYVPHRRLLQRKAGEGEPCSKDTIVVIQGQTAPLPNGIPTYTVEVLNTCTAGCAISGVHLSCGHFSSARLINPSIFRRLAINDCLVNDGHPIPAGTSVTFSYANTFKYPFAVTSVQCPT